MLDVVTDRKIAVPTGTIPNQTIASYTANVTSYSDYYAFGMQLPGRNGSDAGYRYGFNGMEEDGEIKGEGNSYDFGARMYDPRVGRWLSRDAMALSKPSVSPYIGFADNPLLFVDPDGNDEFLSVVIIDERKKGKEGYKLTIRNHTAISKKVRAGAWYQYNLEKEAQNYYDFKTIITVTIDKQGKKSVKKTYYTLDDVLVPRFKRIFLFATFSADDKGDIIDPNAQGWSLEGNGGSQAGGITFTSESGGASPTKYKSLSGAEERDAGELLEVLGGLKNGSLGSVDADKINDIITLSEKSMEVDEEIHKDRKEPAGSKKISPDDPVVVKQTVIYSDGRKGTLHTGPIERHNAEQNYGGKYNKTRDTITAPPVRN